MRTAQQVDATARKIEDHLREARAQLARLESCMVDFRADTSIGDVVAENAMKASRLLTDLAMVAYREAALEQESSEEG